MKLEKLTSGTAQYTRAGTLNEDDNEHNHLSIMFVMRSTLLIIIIITTSPLVLFAKMGSSDAGLFYSTWGTGLHERQLDD